MGAALFTVYQLKTELSFKDIIDIYNKDRDDKQGKYKIQPKSDDIRLENIEDYSVYLLTRKTKPGWRLPLKKLVNNLPEIENTNFSFILFLKIGKYKFAATGGVAHHVISNYKTFNFGVDLLTRLINLDDAAIKRIENRPVTGNILSSSIRCFAYLIILHDASCQHPTNSTIIKIEHLILFRIICCFRKIIINDIFRNISWRSFYWKNMHRDPSCWINFNHSAFTYIIN